MLPLNLFHDIHLEKNHSRCNLKVFLKIELDLNLFLDNQLKEIVILRSGIF